MRPRARLLRPLLAALCLLVLPPIGFGQQPPIKIGLLFPYTGPIATVGQDATRGFELHLAKIEMGEEVKKAAIGGLAFGAGLP